jgi:small-conductance mechanosensitive channel
MIERDKGAEVMKKLLIILFLFYFKLLSAMPSMENIPQSAPTMQEQPAGGMPVAADQSMPQAQAQPQAPQQQATYDQLKWPDSIELSEGQGDVVKTDDPKVVAFSKKASQLADQLKDIASKIKEATDKVNQEMTRINAMLDAFYQKVGFDEGRANAMLK